MACITAEGALTESARGLLAYLTEARSPEEISRELGRPLFQVRASLRELVEAGLVAAADGGYVATDEGREKAGG